MSTEPPGTPGARDDVFSVERAKAFVDAVVAIAMTLLILPLMESVAGLAVRPGSTARWFVEHQDQLISFVLSFAIIGMFWINHHRLFAHVRGVSVGLLWVTMAWLLSIVWLPVATALSGQMASTDVLVKAVYIGSMVLTSLLSLGTRLYLRSHPVLFDVPVGELLSGMSVDLSMITLFLLALVLAVAVPATQYYPLFLMALSGPAQRVFATLLRGR